MSDVPAQPPADDDEPCAGDYHEFAADAEDGDACKCGEATW